MALQDNHVPKSKQVEDPRENLEGEARKLIPENVIDWDDTKNLLMNVYGDPKLLWMNIFSKIKSKLSSWKSKYNDHDLAGTESAMEGIHLLQEFLREAELMGIADASIQIQFESELDTLAGLCPIAWTRKILMYEGIHTEKLKFFHDTLMQQYKLLTKLKINY